MLLREGKRMLVFSTINKFSVMDAALGLGSGFGLAKRLGLLIPVCPGSG